MERPHGSRSIFNGLITTTLLSTETEQCNMDMVSDMSDQPIHYLRVPDIHVS